MLGHHPLSTIPLSGISDAQVTQTETRTLRFASRSFVTRETDAPAHEYVDGRLKRGLRLERHITQADAGQFGALIETRRDDVYFNNEDGRLDYLVNEYAADGRQMRLLIGATNIISGGLEVVQPYASFATVYTTVAGPWTFEHNTVKLRIESLTNRLQNRLQSQTYAGTGGQLGTADLTGRTLPTAFGRCLNIPAQLVDPTILTYQLHGGKMDSISAVYDAGVSVPFDSDYPTYGALVAASVPDGTYASSLAVGFIRLGSIPFGAVTADIRGHRTSDAEGSIYFSTHGGVMLRILLDYAGLPASEIDVLSFQVLDGIQPSSMGLFLPAGDQSSVQEVLERVAFSAGAFIGQDRSGLFRTQRLDPPTAGLVHWHFDDRNILEDGIERLDLPYGVPWRAWGAAYQKNWTIQTDADLATSVTQLRRQFLEAEDRFAYAQSSAIALRHASSSGAPLRQSLFSSSAEAIAEANRLIDLYDAGRALYRIVSKTVLFSVEIGQTVRVDLDRWDLKGGKNFVVVGIEDDADRIETALTVFGGGSTIAYDYDVREALVAKSGNDLQYFETELPEAVISTGLVTNAPTRPSQRGWTVINYPALLASNIGQQAKNVLVPPTYPLDIVEATELPVAWVDPNPSSNTVAAYIGQAPDGSTAIEIRYTPGQVPQHVDAYVPFIGRHGIVSGTGVHPEGSRHLGMSFEVWTQSDFDWGVPLTTGGKVGAGIWGGRRPAAGGADSTVQGGISFRNVWGNGTVDLHARGYGYVLNRSTPTGLLTGQVQNKWLRGQWQMVEYEGYINTPGFADGYARMWIDGECIAEITKAIWALANEWLWRGVLISDAWQNGEVPQSQKRWIRNIRVYVP